MRNVRDRVGEVFDESLPRLLEFLEGSIGQHQQWVFIRKVTLKQVNDLKRKVEAVLSQASNGNGNEDTTGEVRHESISNIN
ncbi:MAG: hypothetical protein HQK50_13010 [Oligoflexia bacterium]|nr:hypothetical protein [Oligoflexia bacterium]